MKPPDGRFWKDHKPGKPWPAAALPGPVVTLEMSVIELEQMASDHSAWFNIANEEGNEPLAEYHYARMTHLIALVTNAVREQGQTRH